MDETTVVVDLEIAEAVLQTLSDAYPRQFQPNEGMRDIFISRLMGLDAAALLLVVEKWIDENRFPPSVAELRQPTLAAMRRDELLAWVEEAQATRPRRADIPGGNETVACGLRATELLTEVKRHFAHIFFGEVELAGFDPATRQMRISHPRSSAQAWWNDDRLRARILDTAQMVAGEPIGIEWAGS